MNDVDYRPERIAMILVIGFILFAFIVAGCNVMVTPKRQRVDRPLPGAQRPLPGAQRPQPRSDLAVQRRRMAEQQPGPRRCRLSA